MTVAFGDIPVLDVRRFSGSTPEIHTQAMERL